MKECPICKTYYDDKSRFCTRDGNPLLEALPGSSLIENKYKLQTLIKHGRLGNIYLATNTINNEKLLVRTFSADLFPTKQIEESFSIEVDKLIQLRNKHVATTYSFGTLPNSFKYIVTEFVEGNSLKEELKRKNILEVNFALEIARQAAIGLGAVHRIGMAHLDLKPDNILLTIDPQTHELIVKVVDFGIARLKGLLGGAITTDTGSLVIRLPYYAPPEEYTGAGFGPHSDIYSLGVILYEMLAGKVPFDDKLPMRVVEMHVYEAPLPIRTFNPDLPVEVEALILQMLAKDSQQRPDSMQVVIDQLTSFIPTEITPITYSGGNTNKIVVPQTPESVQQNKPSISLNLPLRLRIIDADNQDNLSKVITGVVEDASPQGMRIKTTTVTEGEFNIIRDHTLAFKNRLKMEVDLPNKTVQMEGFAVRYNQAADGNWMVFIYIKDMPRDDRKYYELYLKQVP